MNELHLQDKFLIPFFGEGLGYREVKPNTVTNSLIIEEDLQEFISQTELNKKPYESLLKKYGGDKNKLLKDLIKLIQERSYSSRNMALFISTNKSITLQGIKLNLFYTGDSVIHDNKLFDENIFSVVQELPYKYSYSGKQIFSFRPDIVLFVNGIYLGYNELKSNYTNQSALKNGRRKVIKDYFEAIRIYHQHFGSNDMLSEKEKECYRKDFLKIFEKAIHITTTDIGETFVIRTISDHFDDILATCSEGKFDREEVEKKARSIFKPYPLLKPDAEKKDKLKELFTALYGKGFIEKEILYYNFIERNAYATKNGKELKKEQGHLISPRPKQKFGTDKILAKIDEFLEHEQEDDYFEKLLEKQLVGVSETKKQELLKKRKEYSNNKNVYSLLMQYAAGFGKSNIIGWTALQLKDLRRNDEYVYDKIMIVVDRLQLRSQIDSLMLNMNIDNRMYVEARNKKTFQEALASDTRIVIVNLQKFGSVRDMLDAEVLQKLAKIRIVFLIDEIHRSHRGDQHEEMVSIFDELQYPFDNNTQYSQIRKKKNLIIGFTATPDDHALARFGEFSGYAESEKLWRPFDSYTMKEAIEDGFILNPLKNIVPVASKMLFDLPTNLLEGFTEKEYKDAQKKQIYENRDRIDAIAKYVADLLVKDVYRKIHGTGKAMLAVYSIKSAIAYKQAVTKHFNALIQEPKYAKYAEAPIHIVYSRNQDEQSATVLNGGLSEEKVMQSFALNKNGLMIVVAKLQTGFDEKKLHTLFLDKEIKGISAIQTISRVNRTTKYKNDCRIVDFSYNNVNVQNIKDAFEYFSNVVVSDFDPFGDKNVLNILFIELKKSDTFDKFFTVFMAIYDDKTKCNDSERKDRTHSLVSIIGITLLILTILTIGCTHKDDTKSIGMAVEFNDHAACAYVVKENDWYEGAGVNLITYESYATGMRLTSALARGDITVAYICLAPAIMAYARGVPLVIVSGTRKHGYGLVASPCTINIPDLNGATVGCVRERGPADLLLNRMIREYDLKDVRIQRMNPLKQVIALETSIIDVAFLPERHATVAESKGFTMLVTSHELWYEMQGSVLIVKRELIKNDLETVRSLVRVTERATTGVNENPDDAARILAKDLDTEPEIIKKSMSRLNYTTEIDAGFVQEMIDYMAELGYIDEDIRADDMLDTKFLQEFYNLTVSGVLLGNLASSILEGADDAGSFGQAFTDMYGDFEGTLLDALAMELTNNFRRAIFVATPNAVMRNLGIIEGSVHCKDASPEECGLDLIEFLKRHRESRIVLVGFQPVHARRFSKRHDLKILDGSCEYRKGEIRCCRAGW